MTNIHRSAPVRLLSLFVAMTAGVAGAAHAADGITIYGVADVYAEYGKGDRKEVALNSGGASGSRLGFNASKDLGGGLTAIAKAEAGFAIDQGSSTQGGLLFGRQVFAGFTGGFGTLTAGRQYTPQFNNIDGNDPYGTGAGSAQSSGIFSVFTSRANNSVAWSSPTMDNFSVATMVAAGESTTGSSTNSSLAFVNLHYGVGNSNVDLTVSAERHAADNGVNASAVTLGGTYDFGPASIMGLVQAVNNSTTAANTPDNRRDFMFGVHVPVGAETFSAGIGGTKTEGVSGTTATQYTIGDMHNIAKGVDVYGVLTSIKNGHATSYSDDTATGSGPVVSAGKTATALQVGFRYRY